MWTSGYWHDIYSDTGGICTDWEDPDCVGYFTCNEKCRLVQYDGCGDGIPSNGPPPVDAFTNALDANQRSGTLGYEACDDNNNVDGDGCAADCSAIEPGYECLEWGHPCTPLCGNGHIEVYEADEYDTDGVTILNARGTPKPVIPVYDNTGTLTGYRIEECDFGNSGTDHNGWNMNHASASADAYKWPCNDDCTISDSTKWECTVDTSPTIDNSFRNWPAS